MPSRSKRRSPLLLACLVLLSLFIVYKLVLAARAGVSDLYAKPAKQYIYAQQTNTPTEIDWGVAHQSLLQALRYDRDNPKLLSILGWLHLLKTNDETLDEHQRDTHANSAVEYYLQATRLRPTWPYDWANLTLAQYRQGLVDIELFNQSLARTVQFGPWETGPQILVIQLGSRAWESLTVENKHILISTLDRALTKQPKEIHGLLDTQTWDKFCRTLQADEASKSEPDALHRFKKVADHCLENREAKISPAGSNG